jgi:hypothetical protein
MADQPQIDASSPTRDLIRILRVPPEDGSMLPESALWRSFLELRRRGEPQAAQHFLSGLRALHRRRTLGASDLPTTDADPEEHRLSEDPYLGELWRSYKRLVCANRTGPAAQILREVEQQIAS